LVLRLRVGRKGYVILPKALREALGVEEGDVLLAQVGDGILLLKPARRQVDEEQLRRAFREHVEKLRSLRGRVEPRPGELAEVYLEEEFE